MRRLTLRCRRYVLLFLAAAWLSTVSPAGAAPAGETYSLEDAIAIVRKQTAGRVLRATSTAVDGRTVHEVRVLTDTGHVRTLTVDAQTGEVR